MRDWFGKVDRFSIWYGVCQVIGLLVVLMMLSWSVYIKGGLGWRWSQREANVHPLMMTIGFIYIMANSLMIYRGFKRFSKIRLKQLHAVLHLITLTCVVVGLTAMFDYHNSQHYTNLTSLHSWLGLATLILFLIQWCYSFLVFLYPGAAVHVRGKFLSPHVFMGIAIFVMATVASLTGLVQDASYVSKYSDKVFANVLGLFICVFAGLVVFILTKNDFKRLDYHI